ncbi:unnamed protein product [Pseudo-nitzschia multistriata]|uniref:Uncharacterized protein n=1 Tax=Pseudo-nitzschia multistriata TaxID=183589 RepID=A0A448Z8L8_9STRA|nr:unnamed protein product [Pseudo-nitzschia multistriata]
MRFVFERPGGYTTRIGAGRCCRLWILRLSPEGRWTFETGGWRNRSDLPNDPPARPLPAAQAGSRAEKVIAINRTIDTIQRRIDRESALPTPRNETALSKKRRTRLCLFLGLSSPSRDEAVNNGEDKEAGFQALFSHRSVRMSGGVFESRRYPHRFDEAAPSTGGCVVWNACTRLKERETKRGPVASIKIVASNLMASIARDEARNEMVR